ncbi:MAG: phosphoribosylformylglycinamidine cyclo-ligase [Roseofilum sp. SBFL]|uniref:phosphoribosylformylglycinamidine cyclo-ligase n=1 Tax=unclassified Roseofilum TaxID=2620099 RepID=UPI001B1BC5CA|nr:MULTISPECIES: phosphoribosylformylglycinamidine cyclo-ligase [unclassified Roseofilum]MBP0012564.1 phosphoribosylformylglycinamidine cyclo-ligase [Roseofilum sp. SID3]MBP0025462.1 phosphoribosylformylglycinamidine cyclo-ligase [Roseofilum sp. SID2]MBP0040281.1 phosphoribosylformylglycinamidine cyclo-ligase [Roseofilum sp. SID1]MBP0042870.1 phosphoribosylformylglycinamidine cyclo-ligase [Roseofilum sp. SBFL]
MDYQESGVNIEVGRAFVGQIRRWVKSTYRPEVLGGLGGFGGYFQLPGGYSEPVLVSGTDGVGTKLKIAQACDRHDTIGIDLVAMCVNDVLTSGAEPLFFLDYLATGQLNPEQLEQVVFGVAQGCKDAGCALLGGETAEMPGFYSMGEYDLAGFCVGIVEKKNLLDGSKVRLGDVAIALASQGVHSNGFSLVRSIVETQGLSWNAIPKGLDKSLGELLLTPTKIYVKPILTALAEGLDIHGMAHITGGGLPENLPRCLGQNQSISINWSAWEIPPIFQWLAEAGSVVQEEMFNTFNMGIGFVVLIDPEQAEFALNTFDSQGIQAFEIGKVVAGNGELISDNATHH